MLLSFLTFLSFPFLIDSCLETPTKCPCPAVRYIDQIGIANLEYGSYLANRTATRPRVTVTDECQILADVSELDTQNHYLMVFRAGGPPIFAKRLSNDTAKVIRLSDITCSQVGNQHQWQYHGASFADMSVAVQSNEEWCSCNFPFAIRESVDFKKLTCDQFSVVVKNSEDLGLKANLYGLWNGLYMSLASSPEGSLIVDDLLCVNGEWYFNNLHVPASDFYFTAFGVTNSHTCGCVPIDRLMYQYTIDERGAFANYTMRDAIVSYDQSSCTSELTCANPNDTLVIYSIGYKTLVYPPGTKPSISCANSPLWTGPDSAKFWYIDGVMVNDPRPACYSNACPCPFAILDAPYYKYYVGNHPSLENITSSYTIDGPYVDNILTNNDCPDTMSFNSPGLIIFDVNTTATFYAHDLKAQCSSSTKKWTLEGQQFDQLYAMGYV